MRSDSRLSIAGMIAASALLAPCVRAQVKPVTGWGATAPAATGNAKANTGARPGAAASSAPNWSGGAYKPATTAGAGADISAATGFTPPTGSFTASTVAHQPYRIDHQINQLSPVTCQYVITARNADGLATAAHLTITNRSQTTYLTRTTSGNSTFTTGVDITTHYVFQSGYAAKSDPEGYYLPATLAPGASVDIHSESADDLRAVQQVGAANVHLPLSNATSCTVTALGPILDTDSTGSYPGS